MSMNKVEQKADGFCSPKKSGEIKNGDGRRDSRWTFDRMALNLGKLTVFNAT